MKQDRYELPGQKTILHSFIMSIYLSDCNVISKCLILKIPCITRDPYPGLPSKGLNLKKI